MAPRSCMLALLAALTAVAVALPAPAQARLMTYTLTFTASGELDGRPFRDERVRITLIGDVSNRGEVEKLASAGLFLGNIGFDIGKIMKFKQHKDNPTQLPLPFTKPVTMIRLASPLLGPYEFNREIGPIAVRLGAELPARGPVTGETGRRTLVLRSISGRGHLTARWVE